MSLAAAGAPLRLRRLLPDRLMLFGRGRPLWPYFLPFGLAVLDSRSSARFFPKPSTDLYYLILSFPRPRNFSIEGVSSAHCRQIDCPLPSGFVQLTKLLPPYRDFTRARALSSRRRSGPQRMISLLTPSSPFVQVARSLCAPAALLLAPEL